MFLNFDNVFSKIANVFSNFADFENVFPKFENVLSKLENVRSLITCSRTPITCSRTSIANFENVFSSFGNVFLNFDNVFSNFDNAFSIFDNVLKTDVCVNSGLPYIFMVSGCPRFQISAKHHHTTWSTTLGCWARVRLLCHLYFNPPPWQSLPILSCNRSTTLAQRRVNATSSY